jgi:hypothetical protein
VVDLLVQWRQGSGFEVDEQSDANQDDHERDDPAGDERDLEERRRSVLAVFGDLFQACRLRPRMAHEASDFGLDDLAGLEFVPGPSNVLLGAIVVALARVAAQASVLVVRARGLRGSLSGLLEDGQSGVLLSDHLRE